MLMNGAGVMDVLRALGGQGVGASGVDGLSRMMSQQLANARNAFPAMPGTALGGAINTAMWRLGVNPYSGFGQGMGQAMRGMYSFAPDIMGGILGVPNGAQFYSTIANGASGINMAAGFGASSIFNPYSVMANHRRAMTMARNIYDLGTNPDGGYNIAYGHGLNMREMGLVSQRLLSSDIAYTDDSGRRIDPSKESDKFKDNLKKLGSKFNETVSMLSKITGSVEEALNLMDRIGGGNFLGGTVSQAENIANKARKMATAIRVTSAMGGISPQEVYANIQGLQTGMATGIGLNASIASQSGLSGIFSHMAGIGGLASSLWDAMNPNASPQERAQAQLGATGTVQAYMSSNGAVLAAMAADSRGRGLMTDQQFNRVVSSLRSGRTGDAASILRGVMGEGAFSDIMNDPARRLAVRTRASRLYGDLQDRADEAGAQGALTQAEAYGATREIGVIMSDISRELANVTGRGDFSERRDASVKGRLVDMAVKAGMTRGAANRMSLDDLRSFLENSPSVDNAELQRIENSANIEATKAQIDAATMSLGEERAATDRLRREIMASDKWGDAKKQDLISRLGKDAYGVYSEFRSNMTAEEAAEFDKRVRGGKLFGAEGRQKKSRLDSVEQSQSGEFTLEERMRALTNRYNEGRVTNLGRGNLSALADKDWEGASLKEIIASFEGEAGIGAGDRDAFEQDVFKSMMSGIIGEGLGDADKGTMQEIFSTAAEAMRKQVASGKPMSEAFKYAMNEVAVLYGDKIGPDGDKRLGRLMGLSGDKDFISKNLSTKSFLSAAAAEVNKRDADKSQGQFKELEALVNNKGFTDLTDEEKLKKIASLAGELGLSNLDEKGQGSAIQAALDASGGDYKKAVNALLKNFQPEGVKDNSFYAMSAAADPNMAAIAMSAMAFKIKGGNIEGIMKLLPKEWQNALSSLDDTAADAAMNPVHNAWGVGGARALEGTEKRLDELSKLLGVEGVGIDQIKDAFGTGQDAAGKRKALEERLKGAGRKDIGADMALMETLSEKGKLDYLYGGTGRAKKDLGEDYNSTMIDIAKRAGAKQDPIWTEIGGKIKELVDWINGNGLAKTVFSVAVSNFKDMPRAGVVGGTN